METVSSNPGADGDCSFGETKFLHMSDSAVIVCCCIVRLFKAFRNQKSQVFFFSTGNGLDQKDFQNIQNLIVRFLPPIYYSNVYI